MQVVLFYFLTVTLEYSGIGYQHPGIGKVILMHFLVYNHCLKNCNGEAISLSNHQIAIIVF